MIGNPDSKEILDRKYSKTKVQAAGKTIIDPKATAVEIEDAIAVIDYWRLLHAQPLEFIMQSLNKMRKLGSLPEKITIAQRLKTRNSITKKLMRQPNMQLSRMQDIAGCRIVVETIANVYEVVEQLRIVGQFPHVFERQKDYMSNPKSDGYRCFHYICRFCDNLTPSLKDLYVEIQIRSRLQHLWATAVETMSLYTQTDLKASEGPEEILRFFQLAASLFALDEEKDTVPNTPTELSEINAELQELDHKYKITERLRMFTSLTAELDGLYNDAGYYVLELDYATRSLKANYFPKEGLGKASELYSELEAKNELSGASVVLIATSSFEELKAAYPNYFADIKEFSDIILVKNWNPALLHQGDPIKIAMRESISNSIKEYATEFDEYISIRPVRTILKMDNHGGIGDAGGNIYYVMRNTSRLEDSYLRFSGIHFKASEMAQLEKDKLPAFYGKAILLSAYGGSYYVDEKEWRVIANYKSYVLQLREGKDPRVLVMLLLWLKSSPHYWYRLWSDRRQLHKELIPNRLIDFATSSSFEATNKLVDELTRMEQQFVEDFHLHTEQNNDMINELIIQHNDRADKIASILDKVVINSIGLDRSQLETMRDDLKTFRFYQYHDAI